MPFNLTMTGATYDTTGQKFGTAALSAGFGLMPTGALAGRPSMTWQVRTKGSTNPLATRIIMGTTNIGWLGCDAGGNPAFHFDASATELFIPSSYNIWDGAWHEIAAEMGPSGAALYIDGNLVGSNSTPFIPGSDATNPMCIGNFGGPAQTSPTAYQWPGEIDEAAIFTTVRYPGAYTPATAPFAGSESGLLSLYHFDSNGNDSAVPTPQQIAPNDPAIVYSPGNWNVGSSAAVSNNAGAYSRVMFTGTSAVLNFDISLMCTPASQIFWKIDDGPLTKAIVAATVTLAIPTTTAGQADLPYHILEWVIKSTTETANRWVPGQTSTHVRFTGLTLDQGAAVLAPLGGGKVVMLYGDSITEGVRALGEGETADTDRNDATMGWALDQRRLLGAEVGVIGFGGTGFNQGGSGGVPALPSTFGLLYQGVPRTFAKQPDLIVINMSTNDGANNIVYNAIIVLNGLLAACPGAIIAVLQPFYGNQQSPNLRAAIAGCTSPTRCVFVDTTGFLVSAYGVDSGNIHPAGPNNVGRIAPQVAAALRPLLFASSRQFQRGFHAA